MAKAALGFKVDLIRIPLFRTYVCFQCFLKLPFPELYAFLMLSANML